MSNSNNLPTYPGVSYGQEEDMPHDLSGSANNNNIYMLNMSHPPTSSHPNPQHGHGQHAHGKVGDYDSNGNRIYNEAFTQQFFNSQTSQAPHHQPSFHHYNSYPPNTKFEVNMGQLGQSDQLPSPQVNPSLSGSLSFPTNRTITPITVKTNKRNEQTFVMDIAASVVGWVIGRSGGRIKEIQAQTGCKMWVDQDVPNDQPRKIFFHGSKQSIELAVQRVDELVGVAPVLTINQAENTESLASNIVDCPANLLGLLIGKNGWTIKKIQQQSGAQISINQSVREGAPRKIIISGDEASVIIATNLIREVLRAKTPPDVYDSSYGSEAHSGRTSHSGSVCSSSGSTHSVSPTSGPLNNNFEIPFFIAAREALEASPTNIDDEETPSIPYKSAPPNASFNRIPSNSRSSGLPPNSQGWTSTSQGLYTQSPARSTSGNLRDKLASTESESFGGSSHSLKPKSSWSSTHSLENEFPTHSSQFSHGRTLSNSSAGDYDIIEPSMSTVPLLSIQDGSWRSGSRSTNSTSSGVGGLHAPLQFDYQDRYDGGDDDYSRDYRGQNPSATLNSRNLTNEGFIQHPGNFLGRQGPAGQKNELSGLFAPGYSPSNSFVDMSSQPLQDLDYASSFADLSLNSRHQGHSQIQGQGQGLGNRGVYQPQRNLSDSKVSYNYGFEENYGAGIGSGNELSEYDATLFAPGRLPSHHQQLSSSYGSSSMQYPPRQQQTGLAPSAYHQHSSQHQNQVQQQHQYQGYPGQGRGQQAGSRLKSSPYQQKEDYTNPNLYQPSNSYNFKK